MFILSYYSQGNINNDMRNALTIFRVGRCHWGCWMLFTTVGKCRSINARQIDHSGSINLWWQGFCYLFRFKNSLSCCIFKPLLLHSRNVFISWQITSTITSVWLPSWISFTAYNTKFSTSLFYSCKRIIKYIPQRVTLYCQKKTAV